MIPNIPLDPTNKMTPKNQKSPLMIANLKVLRTLTTFHLLRVLAIMATLLGPHRVTPLLKVEVPGALIPLKAESSLLERRQLEMHRGQRKALRNSDSLKEIMSLNRPMITQALSVLKTAMAKARRQR